MAQTRNVLNSTAEVQHNAYRSIICTVTADYQC
jgi:hypothetical protein